MPNEEVQLTAKLKLDTSEAKAQLKDFSSKTSKASEATLPKAVTKEVKGMFEGPKGLQNVARVAKSATGGFRALGGALQGVTSSLGKAGGIVAIVLAVGMLIAKLMEGTDTMEEIKASVGDLIDTLKSTLAPTIAMIGEIILPILDMLKELVEPLGELLNAILVPVLQVTAKLIQSLKPLVTITAKIIKLVAVLLSPLEKMLGLFGITATATTTGKVIGDAKTSLDVWETSGAKSPAEIAADTAAETIELALDKTQNRVNSLFSSVDSGIANIWPQLDKGISILTGGLSALFDTFDGKKLSNMLDEFKNDVKKAFSNEEVEPEDIYIPEVMSDPRWMEFVGGLANAEAEVEDFFKDAWQKVKDWWGSLFGSRKESASMSLGTAISMQTGSRGAVDEIVDAVRLSKVNEETVIKVSVDKTAPAGQRELAQWLLPSMKFLLKRG